jgi:hypothetical protein
MTEESISIIFPTRERPNAVLELLQTLQENTYYKNRLEVCLYFDVDDVMSYNVIQNNIKNFDFCIKTITKPRFHTKMSNMWNIAYTELAVNSIIMLCADDFRFRTHNWDEIVYEEFSKVPDKILLLYGEDGFVSGKLQIATQSFVHRKWIELSPFWLPPYFSCDYCDTWLSDIAEQLGRKKYRKDLIIEHMHVLIGKSKMDNNAQERIERNKIDNNKEIYENKLHERIMHKELLEKYIYSFIILPP